MILLLEIWDLKGVRKNGWLTKKTVRNEISPVTTYSVRLIISNNEHIYQRKDNFPVCHSVEIPNLQIDVRRVDVIHNSIDDNPDRIFSTDFIQDSLSVTLYGSGT